MILLTSPYRIKFKLPHTYTILPARFRTVKISSIGDGEIENGEDARIENGGATINNMDRGKKVHFFIDITFILKVLLVDE